MHIKYTTTKQLELYHLIKHAKEESSMKKSKSCVEKKCYTLRKIRVTS